MNKPKLLDQVQQAIRRKHYSIRTEEAHVRWIKQCFFHKNRHPADMSEREVSEYLPHLAMNQHAPRLRKIKRSMRSSFSIAMCPISLWAG